MLYQFARSGEDPAGNVHDHINRCPLCAQELREYKEHAAGGVMALELWQQVKGRLPETTPIPSRKIDRPREHPSLRDRLFGWFGTPAVAAAAVAVVLLVIFFYPSELPKQMFGFSSVAWEGAPRPKAGPEVLRKSAAYVIVFKNLKTAFSQSQIDALYQALQPNIELSERYRILTPADVRKSLAARGVRASDGKERPEKIGKDLGVETVLMFSITPKQDKFTVEAQLLDTATGARLSEKTVDAVALSELPARLRETADRKSVV